METHRSHKIFIPENGGYRQLTGELAEGTAMNLADFFGYHPDQLFEYTDDGHASGILNACVEVFTHNPVFVATKGHVEDLSPAIVKDYIHSFGDWIVYVPYFLNKRLKSAIEERSLSTEFLARVLGIDSLLPDSIHCYSAKLDMDLYFANGFLVDFKSANSLSEWAKHWKNLNPFYFQFYVDEAHRYWGNDRLKIVREINLHADASGSIPASFRNEYVSLHTRADGYINFVMLKVCHYEAEMDFSLFCEVNRGRYTELGPGKYKLDKFVYEFTEGGGLDGFYWNEGL